MSDGLTPDEIKFFETGDASVLGLSGDAPAPASAPVESPAPSPVPEPAPAPPPPPVEDIRAQQLAQEQAYRAQLEAQLRAINERLEQAAKPPPPPPKVAPDPAQDPYGHLMHEINSIKEALTGISQRTEAEQQQYAQQQQFLALKTKVETARNDFMKNTPDFQEAYQHLRNARAQDYRDVGIAEERIPEALLTDELAVSQNALKQGKNPAEVVYNMAKRYGYTPKAAAPAAVDPAKRVEQIIAGQKAADVPPRGAPTGEITLSSLKDASEADLNKVALDDKLWSKIVGGGKNDIFG